jgi:hypothetical protein
MVSNALPYPKTETEFDFLLLRSLFRADGARTENEVRTLYGLNDPVISTERASEIVEAVFQLFHKPASESISKEEFVRFLEAGGDLVDCEFDGHHGDDEWEVPPTQVSLLIVV